MAQAVKNLPANAGDTGLIPGWGRSPGGGNGNPVQYSCLENSMDRGVWQSIVHGFAKESDTTENTYRCTVYTEAHLFTLNSIKPGNWSLKTEDPLVTRMSNSLSWESG